MVYRSLWLHAIVTGPHLRAIIQIPGDGLASAYDTAWQMNLRSCWLLVMPPLVAVLSSMDRCQPWFNSPWITAVCTSCIRLTPRNRFTDGSPASRAALLQAGFSRACRFRSRSDLRLVAAGGTKLQSMQPTDSTICCVDTGRCTCMHLDAARGRSDMAEKQQHPRRQ